MVVSGRLKNETSCIVLDSLELSNQSRWKCGKKGVAIVNAWVCVSDAAEWLRTTDEVLSSWKNITNLEAGSTYELRVVATNGGVTRASHIEDVTTDGIGRTAAADLLALSIVCVDIVLMAMSRGCQDFS